MWEQIQLFAEKTAPALAERMIDDMCLTLGLNFNRLPFFDLIESSIVTDQFLLEPDGTYNPNSPMPGIKKFRMKNQDSALV